MPTVKPVTGSPTKSPSSRPVEDSLTTAPTPCDYSSIIANDDSVTTDKNTPVIINALDNDVPVNEGDTLTVTDLPYTGRHGTCTISQDASTIWYSPDADYHGEDICVYKTCDTFSKPRCDIATISITILASPDGPVANDDVVTTDKNTSVDISVLDNDVAVPGHKLTVKTLLDSGAHGVCVITSDDVVKYVPKPNYVGSDSCLYKACDDRDMCDTATIRIGVVGEENPCEPKVPPEIVASSPPTDNPIASPTTSPKCDDGRKVGKWHFRMWLGCTNNDDVDDTDTVYHSLEECCQSKFGTVEGCDIHDVCEPTESPTESPSRNPTKKPSRSPTKKPTFSPSGKPVKDTLEPTTLTQNILDGWSGPPDSPTDGWSGSRAPSPTPSSWKGGWSNSPHIDFPTYPKTTDTAAPTKPKEDRGKTPPTESPVGPPTPPDGESESTGAPTWGGTPTVGKEANITEIVPRPEDIRKKLRNMM